jgi:hypothetical protein
MDLVFDLLQGIGIAAAVGIRPLLPVLLVGALASANLGIDFQGTDFAFLEEPPFLFAVVVLVVILDFLRRRARRDVFEAGIGLAAVAGVILVLGALMAGGSMADRDHPVALGLVFGVAAAALAFAASRALFARVRARLDAEAAAYLPIYGEGLALAVAGLSVLFPPLALVVVGALAWLLANSRRREGQKYAGLRILR